MKVIRDPSVYLIGRQVVDWHQLQQFLASVNASDWTTAGDVGGEILVEVGARTCYQSWQGGRPHKEHLAHLIEVGHLSCLEHSVFTVLVQGVSRSLTHELVRHRHLSPSQLSQRYVDESVAEYVEPDIIAADPELHALWLDTVDRTHRAYRELAEKLNNKLASGGSLAAMFLPPNASQTDRRKTARQAARSVLPNATETKIQLTANARAWREFLAKRGSRHADPEIRKLAGAVCDLLRTASPNLFGDVERENGTDGLPLLHVPGPVEE